ncbi:MAG: glycoside hydrolase family 57 protein, partial [Anaerolineae bacterium]
TFVLHTHLPYVREAGRWPFGEEMLHEVAAECYIPLLDALYDLKEEGYRPRLTLGLTPILLEQLADPGILSRLEIYLQERLELAKSDLDKYEREGHGHLSYLARFYHDWYEEILTSFRERYGRDLVGAFRRLQGEGDLEIITSAATHAYLPLMERDSTIHGQLKVGIDSYRRHFGRIPRGVWLPECGYRPAYLKEGRYKPGIEEFLDDLGLRYFFADAHALEGGPLLGKAAGDVIGPYGGVPRRKLVFSEESLATKGTTFRPYFVHGTPVAVFGRNQRTGLQVWSAAHGYPGDYIYREFHRKDSSSGLRYWRVTGSVDLGQKEFYDPYHASNKAKEHANHFAHLVIEDLNKYHHDTSEFGIVVSAYDTELFGHWWFEGVAWLKEVLTILGKSEEVELTTAGAYLEEYPPTEALALPESSWGQGGTHWTWLNPETEWIWHLIHHVEQRMEELIESHGRENNMRRVFEQAARELLLLESSDWPFLISTGQAKEYATSRFQRHLARFNHLAHLASAGKVEEEDTPSLTS